MSPYPTVRALDGVHFNEHALVVGPGPTFDAQIVESWFGPTIAMNDALELFDPDYWIFIERIHYRLHRNRVQGMRCAVVCRNPYPFKLSRNRIYTYVRVRAQREWWTRDPDALFGVWTVAALALSLAWRMKCASVTFIGAPMRLIAGKYYHDDVQRERPEMSVCERRCARSRRRLLRAIDENAWPGLRIDMDALFNERETAAE